MHTRKSSLKWIFALAATAACSDSPSAPPPETMTEPPVGQGVFSAPGLFLSNPVPLTPSGSSQVTVAYVSAIAGTFPGADSVLVRNETIGAPARAPRLVDDGFDPVGIDAGVGHRLSVTVFLNSGKTGRFVATAPSRGQPRIVRTSPAQGGKEIPTSALARVVFSEPIDEASLTASVAMLRNGTPIDGTVGVSADGLMATFKPARQLDSETGYSLEIAGGVRDRDGDTLGSAVTVAFTTEPAIAESGELLFVSLGDRQIYSINVDGSGLVRLTDRGRNEFPAWSPDERRIAFSRSDVGGGFTTDIYIMNGDGSNVVRRTVGSSFRSVAWSPDGRKLAVSEAGVYNSSVWLISADDDGSQPVSLATMASLPAWSPDGAKIAFVRLSGDDGYHQIFVMNADGSDPRALTQIDPGGIYGLGWSPDGKRIAYSKCLEGCDLHAMDADGANAIQVTNVANAQGVSWSPDGSSISLTLSTYVGFQWAPTVAYVSSAGGTPRTVVAGGFHAAWRP